MTPLEKTEAFFNDLVAHYGEGDDREIRAASKLMLVALAKFKEHGGPNGINLADEYLNLAKNDPEKFERILQSNRGRPGSSWLA
ncbi:hypothetical protein [Methylomonas sp. MgM2]